MLNLLQLFSSVNFDLITVGITVAGIGMIGFTIIFNNPKSITSRSFLLFSVVSMLWGVLNYLNYKVYSETLILLFLRLLIFLGVWHAFALFQLIFVFPRDKVSFPRLYKYLLLPIVATTSILTLTPLVFSRIVSPGISGAVSVVQKGPGILVFVIVVVFLFVGSFYNLIKKIKHSRKTEKTQLTLLFYGLLITFFFIAIFNFLLPALFDQVSLIPLGALFILPFILFTAYAIFKHQLLRVKVVSAQILTLVLALATLLEVVFTTDRTLIIFRASIFILVLSFGILLVRSVLREVEQREKIEKQEKELEVINAKLNETNTQLGVANERLRELDKQKSEFVSMASHQLRSPLTAIKGYASLILDGDYGVVTDDLKHAVKIIFDSAQTLATVVSDYLNVTRIELGKMKYDLTNFDLRDLVVAVTEELRPNVEKAGLKLDFTCDTSRHYNVNADKEKLKQVLMNLIDNSVKYTPKGSVHVSLEQKPGRQVGAGSALFAVKDTGIGIHKDVIPKLFGKFSRADNAHTRDIRGTGLGLYIAKQIVEAHQGKIWAESAGEEKGSQFYLELPMVK